MNKVDDVVVDDIEQMTIAELQAYRLRIMRAKEENTLDVGKIKTQIEHAKAKVIQTGRYSDSDWFARVNAALRAKGWRDQMLGNELGRVGNRIRKLRGNETAASFECRFIDAARRKLTGDQFAEIVALAKEADPHQ
jgi:hypothetical protein